MTMHRTALTLTLLLACRLAILSLAQSAFADEPVGFTELFDGKSLDGWDGDPRFWRVEDGVIVGQTTKETNPEQNTFLIHRGGEFDNFELRLSYQVEGFNSGVQYRSVDDGNWVVSGYQCDFEARWHKSKKNPDAALTDNFSGMFFDEKGRMFMGQRGDLVIVRTNPKDAKKPVIEKIASVGDAVELESHIKRDGWNELVVIASGSQFTHIINGHVMAIGIDQDKANRRASGLFAFQLHKGQPMKIQVKDIRVRRLANSKEPTANASASELEKVTSSKDRNRQYEQYALRHAGNAANGQKLFADQRTKCAICHKVAGKGGDVGKDLSSIGGKFGRPHLIESLLEPSQQIVEGYRTTNVVTNDGKVVSGIVKSESEQQITLADANGKIQTIYRDNIDAQSVGSVSIMPEGLASALSLDEFTDVIAYLETLGTGNAKRGGGVKGVVSMPEGFEMHTVATGLDGLTALEVLPDGRVLVCEQSGRVRVIENGRLLDEPFVTLPVESYWERGVIGVTHDLDFPRKPYIYICWTGKEPYPHHRVSRFTMQGNVAVQGSEDLLLVGDDQNKMGGKVPAGHQAGALHFGPDGKLYIAIGEQTSGAPAQKLDTFLGKILRINSDGSIPDDNPFVAEAKGKYKAIWAYGCRNPFTFAFRKPDGLMLINDVGGNFEEINIGRAGANYGWPLIEHGDEPAYKADEYDGPIHWYPQSSLNGGDFCPTDSNWPKQWQGRFFFADYQHGWIKTIDPADAQQATQFVSGVRQPVDLRFASDGSLYVLLRNAWVIDGKFQNNTGSVVRVRPSNVAPKSAARSPSEPVPPKTHSAPKRLPAGKVVLTEDAVDESADGLAAYKIETETATYFLEKMGGGLSSLVDQDGNDWLGFHPRKGSGAGGEFRGFPNAVYKQDGSYFHAKNAHVDFMKTRVEQAKEGYVSIIAHSPNGNWQGRYEFFATHCTFTMIKMPSDKKYWVLYEGTPGGDLNPDDWWMTSAIKSPQPIGKHHEGDIPAPEWMAFGDKGGTRSIVMLNHQDDGYPDTHYQMKEQMTVFGFGRSKLDAFHAKIGQRFSIGLVESSSHDGISAFANGMAEIATSIGDVSFGMPTATPAARAEPLTIDLWYGPKQRFGHNGNPQRWVNVLGKLKGQHDSVSLSYSLNGGEEQVLSIGPNGTRLANRGDFNVEIDRSELADGENSIVLHARDGSETTSETVSLQYVSSAPTRFPLHIDWSKAKRIDEVAQVTDG
ncbi:MAG: PQQ-dependent sugar dehydrogenase, partial [Pirellulaceae bacterium]